MLRSPRARAAQSRSKNVQRQVDVPTLNPVETFSSVEQIDTSEEDGGDLFPVASVVNVVLPPPLWAGRLPNEPGLHLSPAATLLLKTAQSQSLPEILGRWAEKFLLMRGVSKKSPGGLGLVPVRGPPPGSRPGELRSSSDDSGQLFPRARHGCLPFRDRRDFL